MRRGSLEAGGEVGGDASGNRVVQVNIGIPLDHTGLLFIRDTSLRGHKRSNITDMVLVAVFIPTVCGPQTLSKYDTLTAAKWKNMH